MASAQKRGQSPPHIFRGLNDRGRHVIAAAVIAVVLAAFALLLPTRYGLGAEARPGHRPYRTVHHGTSRPPATPPIERCAFATPLTGYYCDAAANGDGG